MCTGICKWNWLGWGGTRWQISGVSRGACVMAWGLQTEVLRTHRLTHSHGDMVPFGVL